MQFANKFDAILVQKMLSRRDKLLIRPWQQKRFENHRRKVSSALPAIDDKPPVYYNHVALKLKRQQLERERITKIEKENLILLRKLNHIMKTCRVDHFWTIPQPDFLNREPIYNVDKLEILDDTFEIAPTVLTQKTRCLACCPDYQPPKQAIPEERVPWAPMKLPVAKPRSQSVPLPKISSPLEKQPKIKSAEIISHTKTTKAKDAKQKKIKSAGKRLENQQDYRDFCQSLVLRRGNFKLVVNFPSDTTVSVHDAFSEKVLLGKPCTCKAIIKSK